MTTLEKIRTTQLYQDSLEDLVTAFQQQELPELTYRVCYSYRDTTEQVYDSVDYDSVESTLKQFARLGATVHSIRDMSGQTVYKK